MFENLRRHLDSRVSISDSDFELITQKIKVKRFKKKEMIARANEVADYQGYINSGSVRMFFTDDKGHEHVVQLSFEDWWTGDIMSFVTGQPADYSIEALEESELFLFQRDDMETLYHAVPQLERSFRILTQNALVAMQQRMVANMSKSAEERYLNLIKKFPHLELRIAQHHIASFLGITPEALSRIKKSLIDKSKNAK
ncbi:MAG: Crp/Fnr family transcriptional regulator [Flavobacteriales bacterium]